MKKCLVILLALLVFFALCVPSAFGLGAGSAGARMVPGEVLVKYRTGASAGKLGSLMRSVNASVEKKLLFPDMALLKLKGVSIDEALKELLSSPLIEYASPNYIRSVNYVPNDPNFNDQWNFDDPTRGGDINMPEAWDIERGGSPGVVVAVIDSGVAYRPGAVGGQCPDLVSTNFVQGYDFVNGDAFPDDDNGHGTHV
ncbi:MAG: hypothetical protein JJE48_10655, partial [Actinobacteria bacterium]|nr:hypothetical protein [Actinomycetota bacterium]